MKKLVALTLALALLFTLGGAALATGNTSEIEVPAPTDVPYEDYDPATGNATTADDMFIDKNGKSQQETDIYVKVRATGGQIDATVPLIIVVSTDISGTTTALTPSNYGITSYSSVDLRVTNVAVTVSAPDASTNVEWVLANPTDLGFAATRWSGAAFAANDAAMNTVLNSKTSNGAKNAIALTLKGLVLDAANDLTTIQNSAATDAAANTTFKIAKINPTANDGTEIKQTLPLDLQVRTSKLNFVTYTDDTDTTRAAKGVHALKITYTIDADVSTNYKGEDIVIDHDSTHTP